ncbi:death domain-associated protein 6 isoform X2 [Oreochromis niloticus]|uniref:death domain-associated protein 6 isoform X2 n=1 Tax=Oreochromis niloticus TaxID=8128 RepID=UPI000393DFB8|nr:death domain-associated protein 6 isoform X2 [Oreochromis niloticus]
MAVAPAWMADKIIVLDEEDKEEESPQPSSSASKSSPDLQAKNVSPLKAQQPVPTHITQSPFATAKKTTQCLQAENQKLFTEFVEHCRPLTEDCPEVLTFLQTKHSKACPDFLSSVELRNTLGRCLTRAQANRSKTFVYINELCTVLKQHAIKKRQTLSKVDPGPSTSTSSDLQSTSVTLESTNKSKGNLDEEEEGVQPAADEEQPSTSGQQENREADREEERKAKRASRKQIGYLENLLKVYNEEICRLQQAELSLTDMEAEDSLYIQEHKLKRKMMKIYEKLCELKGCSTLTGRAIEQRITYKSTRYPEINRRIERFINSPEVRQNPPDYQDILQQVLRANDRHNLCLTRKHINQIAQEAFRETGSRIQERRHLDLVYNFGSSLTDAYKPATDPALKDPSLLKKLRSNREVALTSLEEVIKKYAVKQDDTEEEERNKRLQKDRKDKEGRTSGKKVETEEMNGVSEEEEEEDEDDESSDPDIEEEIQASTQQDGPDEEDDEEDDINEVEQVSEGTHKEDQNDDQIGHVSAGEEGSMKDEDEQVTSPASDETKSQISPLSDIPSPTESPSQSEPMQTDDQRPLSNGDHKSLQEPADSSSHESVVLLNYNQDETGLAAAANGKASPSSPEDGVERCGTQTSNGTSPPPSPRTTRSQKRKWEERNSQSRKNLIIHDSDADIPLDMGVVSCNSPETTRANTPMQEVVNVATQCDPDEIIVLSDSE